jgi:hypothetical protein
MKTIYYEYISGFGINALVHSEPDFYHSDNELFHECYELFGMCFILVPVCADAGSFDAFHDSMILESTGGIMQTDRNVKIDYLAFSFPLVCMKSVTSFNSEGHEWHKYASSPIYPK